MANEKWAIFHFSSVENDVTQKCLQDSVEKNKESQPQYVIHESLKTMMLARQSQASLTMKGTYTVAKAHTCSSSRDERMPEA